MKKAIIALASIAAASASVQAQTNVSVYGLIDTAVEYTSNASAAKNSLVRLNSGGMNTSRWGLRGTEDLGGDLKAVFQLESGIKVDTGDFDSAGIIFNRQANMGFEGSFGRVVAGRSFSTTYDFILPFDPMGYSPLYSWATSGNATAPTATGTVRKDGMLTGVSNMLKYQGTFSNFKLGAAYAFGEQAGDTNGSAKYDIALGYENGPFAAAVTFDQQNGTASATGAYDKTTIAHAGASYQLSGVKVLAGYRDFKKTFASAAAAQRSNMYWGGAVYQATPVLTVTGAVYYQDIKDVASTAENDPVMYVLRGKYALSKRTDLYAVLAYAKAKNGLNVGLSRDDAGFGSNQTGLVMGMQHRF